MGHGPRVPFQRAMSMDGKPPGGPGGAGRRPMLIKQENSSLDGYPGNMGVSEQSDIIFPIFICLSLSYSVVKQMSSLTIYLCHHEIR